MKDNPILFPVVTIIIMETFINKMRRLQGIRKMILIEEAWKAIAKEGMANYIRYLFKTVRKFYGEAVVVTQEVDDIISSPVVKETIINNSDCKILLDQRKYQNKFDQIQNLLGLTDKERSQILSINLANAANRLYKEVLAVHKVRYMRQKFRLKSTFATPPKRLRNWNLSALRKSWAETSSWLSNNLPKASGRKTSNQY